MRFLYAPSAGYCIGDDFKYARKHDDVREIKEDCVSSDKGERRVPLAVEFFEKRAAGRVNDGCDESPRKEERRIRNYAEQISRGYIGLIVKRREVAAYIFGREDDAEKFGSVFGRGVAEIKAQHHDDYCRAHSHYYPLLPFGFSGCELQYCIYQYANGKKMQYAERHEHTARMEH